MDGSIVSIAMAANASGAAAAMPHLCRILAEKGIISAAETETVRHAALLGYDRAREGLELSKPQSQELERLRAHADSLWQSAAEAAERRG